MRTEASGSAPTVSVSPLLWWGSQQGGGKTLRTGAKSCIRMRYKDTARYSIWPECRLTPETTAANYNECWSPATLPRCVRSPKLALANSGAAGDVAPVRVESAAAGGGVPAGGNGCVSRSHELVQIAAPCKAPETEGSDACGTFRRPNKEQAVITRL